MWFSRSERESYGDSAIGYVQVKREADICTVKARITPEHNVRQKCYSVTAVCNEEEQIIISAQCEDCAAHLGGCKHAIAFLAWLHRRSEDPSTTSVDCYWQKSKLSKIGTSLKFIKAKNLGNSSKVNLKPASTNQSVLQVLIGVVGMDSQLMKYYRPRSPVENLSVHLQYLENKATNASDFIEYLKKTMDVATCKEAYKATMEQSECPLWHELRYARITASKAYDAAHCKTMDGTLTESILGATKLKDTAAMKRGRDLEKEVLKIIEKRKRIKINKCGIILNPDYPVMGASPDGESTAYSIEIKCPSTKNARSQYITKKNKITSKYMGQVQLQMHFANKKKALFCVADSEFETNKAVDILFVDYDKEYCENTLAKCNVFWSNAIFPILCQKK